ncbi:hypothetical protein WJX72_005113 [[Myrmecia] bisecta]|uniref:Uncharacterized protein n=1 Tax=[Myrmecia] bisecta TaxID=41462 RepID=A0AAW1PCU0_9CHLO
MRLSVQRNVNLTLPTVPGSPSSTKAVLLRPGSPTLGLVRTSEPDIFGPELALGASSSQEGSYLIPSSDTRPARVKFDIANMPSTRMHRRTLSGQLVSLSTSASNPDFQAQASASSSAPLVSGSSLASSSAALQQGKPSKANKLRKPLLSRTRSCSPPKTDDYHLTLRVLNKAHQRDPYDPVTLFMRGWAKMRVGDQGGAKADLDMAMELDPSDRFGHGRRLQRALKPWWRRGISC